MANRAIVTVAYGKREDTGKPFEGDLIGQDFGYHARRFRERFAEHGKAELLIWDHQLPPQSPPHMEKPYAFKAYALKDAWLRGYEILLWADAAVFPRQALDPLWWLIEQQGYWLSKNLGGANCGEWCCDSALEPLGITREEAFNIAQVAGTAFGLDTRTECGGGFFKELIRYAEKTNAHCGPWVNRNGEASPDPRVKGHRHDQTVMSVMAYKMGLKLTEQPDWFTDSGACSPLTILICDRLGNMAA